MKVWVYPPPDSVAPLTSIIEPKLNIGIVSNTSVSAAGDIIQFTLMVVVLYLLTITNTTIGWFIGSILSIPFRHILHRYIVFGDYIGGYYKSLVRMYIVFSVVSILSTAFHGIVSTIFPSLHYTIVFIITINATGISNFVLLKKVWCQQQQQQQQQSD